MKYLSADNTKAIDNTTAIEGEVLAPHDSDPFSFRVKITPTDDNVLQRIANDLQLQIEHNILRIMMGNI